MVILVVVVVLLVMVVVVFVVVVNQILLQANRTLPSLIWLLRGMNG